MLLRRALEVGNEGWANLEVGDEAWAALEVGDKGWANREVGDEDRGQEGQPAPVD